MEPDERSDLQNGRYGGENAPYAENTAEAQVG